MLTRALLVLGLATVFGCDGVGPEPGPPIEVESLGWAVPPDSLLHLTPEEWMYRRPIVEIVGVASGVVVTGDYALPAANTWVVGTAEIDRAPSS